MPQLLDGLFGPAVAVVETRTPGIDESLLWPSEASLLGDVVEKRRWDFVAGRRCARLAMAELGHEPEPVMIGPRREPVWPDDLVGSITHTRGPDGRPYAAAVAAHRRACRGLGVDAEPDEALPAEIVDRILFDEERDWADSTTDVTYPGRLIFCAKEAAYKVWYPMTRRWLGFEDVRVEPVQVEPDGGSGSFRVETRVGEPTRPLAGRFRTNDGLILAAIEAPL